MGKKGVLEIKKHVWFAEIDWAKLLAKELQPPWTPDVKGAMDFRYVPKRLIKNEARDSEQDEATVAQGVKEVALSLGPHPRPCPHPRPSLTLALTLALSLAVAPHPHPHRRRTSGMASRTCLRRRARLETSDST